MSALIASIIPSDPTPTDEEPTGEEGQGLAEYALILALIAIVATAAVVFLGTQITALLSTVGNNI